MFLLLFAVVISFCMVTYFYLKVYQKNIRISSLSETLNYEYKPAQTEKKINTTTFLNKLDTKPFKNYKVIVEIKPLEKSHIFSTYFSTLNPENMENISSVDTIIDNNNETITIIIYINKTYPLNENEIESEVNRYLVTGFLYAQSQLEKKQLTPELRTQIYNDSYSIYKNLRETNSYWILYE